jgi:DNA-binding beta-propeller fold protein YncE
VAPVTGILTPIGSVTANAAEGIAIDATGKFVYVTDRYSPSPAVSEFSINANGTLAPVGAGIVPLPVGAEPTGIITAY